MTLGRVFVTLVPVLILVVAGCDPGEEWTHINRTDVPLIVTGTRGGPVLRSFETMRTLSLVPQIRPGVYVFKAYEFVPGAGRLFGWAEAPGGGQGEMVFCRVYVWEELKKLKLTVEVVRNVPPGILGLPYDFPSERIPVTCP